MPFIIADRVRETSSTVGTGSIALGGAVVGYQTFDAVMDTGDTAYYTFADQAGGPNWEVGIGTFTAPSTLARTTILSSSNGGSIVTFGSGTKDVFISLPASRTNVEDQPNIIEVNSSSDALRITQTGAGNALLVEDSANPDSSPFVVDASGNVGIGTTAPGARLAIQAGAGTAATQTIYTGSNAAASTLSFGQTGAVQWDTGITATNGDYRIAVNGGGTAYDIVRSGAAVNYHAFSTGGSERMRIDASGNVGIGTSSPTGRLSVTNGDDARVKIFSNGGSVGVIDAVANTNDATGRWLSINPTGGNVGIGTSGPTAPLTVKTRSADNLALRVLENAGSGIIQFTDDPVTAERGRLQATSTGNVRLYGASTAEIYTAGSERMRIDASGNVGIGTASPAGRLHARFDAGAGDGFTGRYIFQTTDQRLTIGTYWQSGVGQNARIQSSTDSGVAQALLLNPDGGNVGIGTSGPGQRLVVSGNQQILGGNYLALFESTNNNQWQAANATNNLTFTYNSTEYFRFGSSGQLGLGGANYGTSGQVLTSNGAAAAPSWQTVSATGRLLNVQVFTSSGTYTRTANVTRAVVIAVGGGGGAGGAGSGATGGGNGGTTSFGSQVSAAGGSGSTGNGAGALGGTGGTGATIAIRGAPGVRGVFAGVGSGGSGGAGGGQGGGVGAGTNSPGGTGVRGGGGGGSATFFSAGCCTIYVASGGGGQGETAIDYIASGLNATETVTIGAGGTGGVGTGGGGAGGAGYIIVYEYS